MSKKSDEALRLKYTEILSKLLAGDGEEVLRVNSNQIAIPVVDSEGEDQYIVFTVKVPTGSHSGEVYDGYDEAANYKFHVEEQAKKAQARKEEEARKFARAQKMREQKAAAKTKRIVIVAPKDF